MSFVEWECPNCGVSNTNNIEYAEMFTCKCTSCSTECEVYFEIDISITDIKVV